jgi:hypothetical protein
MFEDISPVKKPIDNITNLQSSHMFMKVYELSTSPPPPQNKKQAIHETRECNFVNDDNYFHLSYVIIIYLGSTLLNITNVDQLMNKILFQCEN